MSLEQFWWIWNRERWIPFDQGRLVRSSDPTTSCLVRMFPVICEFIRRKNYAG